MYLLQHKMLIVTLTNNIIVSPHGLAWTDECFLGIGRNAVAAICRLAAGRLPEFIVNPEAARHQSMRDKLRIYAERYQPRSERSES